MVMADLKLGFALLACLCLGALAGFYGKDENVITDLNKENFGQRVFGSTAVWLVEFYAPWCGHCQKFTPEFSKAAKKLSGIVKVAAINVDEHKEIAGAFQIQSLPTVVAFPSEVTQREGGKPGEYVKQPMPFKGARNAKSVIAFAAKKLPDLTTVVTSDTLAQFESEKGFKALLFTPKSKPSVLYKGLATTFKHRVLFAIVSDKEEEIAAKYGVEKFPTLVIINADGEHEVYDGEMKGGALDAHFADLAPMDDFIRQQQSESANEGPPQKKEPKEPVVPEVVAIDDQETFQQKCLKHKLCLVALLDEQDEEAHKAELEELQKVAEKFVQRLEVVWVNPTKHPNVGRDMGLSEMYPTLGVLVTPKKRVAPFMYGFEAEEIITWLNKLMGGNARNYGIDNLPSIQSAENTANKDEL